MIQCRVMVVGTFWRVYTLSRKTYNLSEDDLKTVRLYEKHWFESGRSVITDRAMERWVKINCTEFSKIVDFAYEVVEVQETRTIQAKAFSNNEYLTNPE